MAKSSRHTFISRGTDPHPPEIVQQQSHQSAFQEAMALHGITDFDLDALCLRHFMKQTKTIEEAQRLYAKHTERRARFLEGLGRTQSAILRTPKTVKPSGEALHEQLMITLLAQHTADRGQQNERILRRLAVQQLRTVFQSQRNEVESTRVESYRGRCEVRGEESADPEEPTPMKDVELRLKRTWEVRREPKNRSRKHIKRR
jgi:hypothetical protein